MNKHLKTIAQETNGNYFKSLDEQTLNEIFVSLSSNLEYEIEYSTLRDWFIVASNWIAVN